MLRHILSHTTLKVLSNAHTAEHHQEVPDTTFNVRKYIHYVKLITFSRKRGIMPAPRAGAAAVAPGLSDALPCRHHCLLSAAIPDILNWMGTLHDTGEE